MRQQIFFFKGCGGKLIHTYFWEAVSDARAVVQISHGMAEHAERYAGFAEWLNDRGYTVYADDHRGHGRTAGIPDEIGYIGEDGFNRIVEDEYILTKLIKEKHPGLPVFLLGHSFGSFIAQEYISRYGGGIAGVILSGSAMNDGPDVKAGLMIASVMKLFGDKRPNALLDGLMFGRFNSRVENPSGKFDWLSRDGREVARYDGDPLCGGVFTTNFFYEMLKGLSGLYTREKTAGIPKKLPVCIISGENDPVGGYGKRVAKLHALYVRLGIEDLTLKLYRGGRHEMLNEINREEVFEDIAAWLEPRINTQSK